MDVLRWKWQMPEVPFYKEPEHKLYHRKCGGVVTSQKGSVMDSLEIGLCDKCKKTVCLETEVV